MARRASHLIVATLVIGTALFAGCAKRPATTAASAPAPTGAAATTTGTGGATATTPTPPPAAAAPPATAAAPTPAARPQPKEFVAVADLKPIYFDFDKYDIRPGDARVLDTNAQWLKSNANQLVLIEGHCDERGTQEYNLALGERRAVAVRTYLVSLGVAADRLHTISYGKEFPFDPGRTVTAWAKNRRAHFVITAK